MAIDTKTAVLGVLLIGIVAMAGWVGFLYVNPVIKTRTKTDEETETVYSTITTVEEYGIPDDWIEAKLDASFSVYNETGGEITVTMTDILNGIMLFYEQAADPEGREINEYKYEYMEVLTVEDESTGHFFSGVNILDVLKFSGTHFAWNISCKTNDVTVDPDIYFNMTTGDIINLLTADLSMPTIVAIAADGEWLHDLGYGNFSVIQGQSLDAVYDLKEIKTIDEWQVDIMVNGSLEYQINRKNIVDPYNPDGDHYEYYKYPQSKPGGQMNFNRTYWGTNMSYFINQTSAFGLNYTMQAIAVDGYSKLSWNNTDVNNGLVYPVNYGVVNKSAGNPSGPNGVPLLKTDLLMTLIYMEQVFTEYGMYPTDPVWDKAYYKGYSNGPFFLVIPGQTANNYPGLVKTIVITTYTGSIP